jgi:KDO2-lipid IV(A) lauroyltransferase
MLFRILGLPFLWLISRLPFGFLYVKSYFLHLLIFYGVRYRRATVFENLRRSFPDKKEEEIYMIAKAFYRNFCDVVFETIKLTGMSANELKKRCAFDKQSVALFQSLFAKNKSIIGISSHCGNWEWGFASYQVHFDFQMTGVYHPLSNKKVDAWIRKTRERFGAELVPMKIIYRHVLGMEKNGKHSVIGLISDQSPPPESAHWTQFLHQNTPVFNGPEKLARKFDLPVVFMHIRKLKRGYYQLHVELITDNAAALPEGKISDLHVQALERNILEQPEIWLWSHRRWKHAYKTIN